MSTSNNKQRTTRRYSDAFRRQVVEAIEQEGYTHPRAAEIYGCSQSSIHRWIKKYESINPMGLQPNSQTTQHPTSKTIKL